MMCSIPLKNSRNLSKETRPALFLLGIPSLCLFTIQVKSRIGFRRERVAHQIHWSR